MNMTQDETESIRSSAIYWSCADVLMLASQLPNAQLPSPAELRQRLLTMLDRMVANARANRLSDADIAEARYAIVAFIDEQILKSTWAGRTEWMNQPLQLLLYKEYTAGENFFARLRTLLNAGNRPLALEAYYLCLALGFRGASGAEGEASTPEQMTDTARNLLARVFPPQSQLSPHGRLREQTKAERHSRLPFIAWIVVCLLLAGGTWFALGRSINQSIDRVTEQIPSMQGVSL